MTDMQLRTMAAHPERIDLKIVAGFVTKGARVLDVGCGDGALLQRLEDEKQVGRPRHRAVAEGRERGGGARAFRGAGRRRP